MKPVDLVSIELALGAALLVALVRLFSLWKATWEVPAVHQEILGLLDQPEPRMEEHLKTLSYKNPYAEAAAEMRAAGKEGAERLADAAVGARSWATRRARRGQTLDLLSLCLLTGVLVVVAQTGPVGPVSLVLAACTILLLLITLATRSILASRVHAALRSLEEALQMRPSTAPGAGLCPFCGSPLRPCKVLLLSGGDDSDDDESYEEEPPLTATICDGCGKVLANAREATRD